jgi:plastocyanin
VRRILFGCLVVSLVVSACSSSKPKAGSNTSPSPTKSTCVGKAVPISFNCPLVEFGNKDATSQGKEVRLKVVLGESSFDPTFIKTKPGAHVTLSFDAAAIPHTFTIDGVVNQSLTAGKPNTVTLTLPTSGPVIFYCAIHQNAGMKGAFYFS